MPVVSAPGSGCGEASSAHRVRNPRCLRLPLPCSRFRVSNGPCALTPDIGVKSVKPFDTLVGCSLGDRTYGSEVKKEGPTKIAESSNNLDLLGELVRRFTHEREWEKYHDPRSLILALMGELGELAELFQWRTDGEAAKLMQDSKMATKVSEELADVFGYLLQLADVTGIHLGKALEAKMKVNEKRYPADLARGNARKYTELSNGD